MPRRVAIEPFSIEQRSARTLRTQVYISQAREPGTRRNRACHLRQYEDFCGAFGVPPWPVSVESLGNFVSSWADRNQSSKVDGLISTLRTESLGNGHPFTAPMEYYISLLRQGLAKAFRPTTRRKLPFTLNRLEAIAPFFDLHDPWHLQALTMAYVAHDGLLRAGELLALQWDDVQVHEGGYVSIRIKQSKTSHARGPEFVSISPYQRNGVEFCGASLLGHFISHCKDHRACRSSDYIFGDAEGGRLAKSTFVTFMQSKLREAGIHRPDEYSGHSFRAGGATDLFEGGAPPRVIMLTGRWRSDAYLLYIRDHWRARTFHASQAFSQARSVRWLGAR